MIKLKKKQLQEITKSCSLCEYARKVEISGEYFCTRKKNLKRVSEDHVCSSFSFDILSYCPNPTKIPKFTIESVSDIL